MYGFYILAIVFGSCLAAVVISWVSCELISRAIEQKRRKKVIELEEKEDEIYAREHPERPYRDHSIYDYQRKFDKCGGKTWYSKHEIGVAFSCLLMIAFLGFLVSCLVGGLNTSTAYAEYDSFIETQELVESADLEGTEYEKILVYEANSWLVKAKKSLEKYGNWSMYYCLDLENVSLIAIGGSE